MRKHLSKIILFAFILNLYPAFSFAQETESEDAPAAEESANTAEENSAAPEEAPVEKAQPEVKKQAVQAAEPEEKVMFSPEIEWDEPGIKPTNRPNVHEVNLNGVTEKGVQVRVGKEILWVRVDKKGQKKVKKLPVKRLAIKGKKIVDMRPDGSFSINLRLPEGEVQVPVGLVQGKKSARYQLAMFVKDKKIELKDQPKMQTDCRYCIWLGAGFAYLAYQQDPPQDIKDVEYGAFGFPALTFRTSIQIVKNWKIRFAYHYLTGPELSSEDVTIIDKSIKWQHMGLEVDYRALGSFRLFGFKFDPAILVGMQIQDMPFLVQTTGSEFTIQSFKFNTASIGGMFYVNSHKKWYYEIFMRVQAALSSTGDVELSSGFAFDGSLGAIYRIGENLRLGMFWGGQYHTYKYEIDSAPGTYSLLNSKMDLSVGYEF